MLPTISLANPPEKLIKHIVSLQETGDIEGALRQAREVVSAYPNACILHNLIGVILKSQNCLDMAIDNFQNAIKINPKFSVAHYNLGNAYYSQGSLDNASKCYKAALREEPELEEALHNLGNVYQDKRHFETSFEYYNKALNANSSNPQIYNNYANALRSFGMLPEAVVQYKKSIKLDPSNATFHCNIGIAYKNVGKMSLAISHLQLALKLNPSHAESHLSLSSMKIYHAHDSQVSIILGLMKRADLAPVTIRLLSFTLAKAYEDMGDLDLSFGYYEAGNKLRKLELNFDIKEIKKRVRSLKMAFKSYYIPSINDRQKLANQSSVFVVGMPRSGTSLVEQILSSHSNVHGAGELMYLKESVERDTQNLVNFDDAKAQKFAGHYRSKIENLKISEDYVVDKMPLNFLYIGYILATMPDAKVLHIRRDAIAVCWSIYKTCFSNDAIDFGDDLEDLIEFYKLYDDLMAFWEQQFPNRILHICYENLTENQELESKRLLAYCGLPWEGQCLDFHENKRAVLTASATQVRQKMYTGSSQSWRKFEKHLGPLIDGLKDL